MTESIKQAMSKKLITLPWGHSIDEAEQLMLENRIRHLPIVDDVGCVLGILSQRDVCSVMGPQSTPVERAMQTHVEIIHEDTNLRSAVLKMLEKKISCLLVADDTDSVVGIVTTDDMLWCLAEVLHKEEENETSAYTQIKDRAMQTIGDLANRIANMGI